MTTMEENKKISYKDMSFLERKEVYKPAYEKLLEADRLMIDRQKKILIECFRSIGEDSALELLSAIGMFLMQNEVMVEKKG